MHSFVMGGVFLSLSSPDKLCYTP